MCSFYRLRRVALAALSFSLAGNVKKLRTNELTNSISVHERRMQRYRSQESLGSASGSTGGSAPRRSRTARTERYLQRRSTRDDEAPSTPVPHLQPHPFRNSQPYSSPPPTPLQHQQQQQQLQSPPTRRPIGSPSPRWPHQKFEVPFTLNFNSISFIFFHISRSNFRISTLTLIRFFLLLIRITWSSFNFFL